MSIARTIWSRTRRPTDPRVVSSLSKKYSRPHPTRTGRSARTQRGRRLLRQHGHERRIELRESFARQTLRDAVRAASPREARAWTRIGRPGGREREVMGRRRAKDAVRLRARSRTRVPAARASEIGCGGDDGRERVDGGKRNEGAEQIHAGAEDERERSRDAHGPAGTCARETREERRAAAAPAGEGAAPIPPARPTPTTRTPRGGEERPKRHRRARAARRGGGARRSRTARGGRSARTRTAPCSGAP